jgi:hypothetical protein
MKTIKLAFRSLEKQVCSLKWAKRLREIGIRQDTYYQWIYDYKNDSWDICASDYYDEDTVHVAAFTAQDFIDLFPHLFTFKRREDQWIFSCDKIDMQVHDEENLADVFARILITITKNKNVQSIKELTVLK